MVVVLVGDMVEFFRTGAHSESLSLPLAMFHVHAMQENRKSSAVQTLLSYSRRYY